MRQILKRMSQNTPYIKGRGAQINPSTRYDKYIRDEQPIDWALQEAGWEEEDLKTQYLETHPKTIVNAVTSDDIPADWSLNPYQGCEHGCIYCYARNTHPYWGYSAGLDFERVILVKRNAAALLEQELKKPAWKASPIMFAGNTDIYQPCERKFGITRQCLEVFWKYRHPVGMITKNSLILRDLDLLQKLASENLVHAAISITTLDDKLRQLLEPRTASVAQRLRTVEVLAAHNIPVVVMIGPIIPGLNDPEIFSIVKAAAERGALGVGYNIVRLPGEVGPIFEDWVRKVMPARADKILNRIREAHGGQLSDSRFGTRMRGEGKFAEMIRDQMRLAREKFLGGRKMPEYNLEGYEKVKNPQLKLWG